MPSARVSAGCRCNVVAGFCLAGVDVSGPAGGNGLSHRHGGRRPAIHDFHAATSEVVDGAPEPVPGRLTRVRTMTWKGRRRPPIALI